MPDERPNRSLADFIAPRETGVPDYLGMFAVTAGLGVDDVVRRFEREHDDYNAIMVKALADRLAEAFAEYLHAQARKDWGYGARRAAVGSTDLIGEKFRGIRPAYGYPACPDHSEKFKLFELLDAGRQGIVLTDHAAMIPAASVSGLYFCTPGRDSTSTSAGSAATSSSRTRGERTSRSKTPSAGSDPTSPMIRFSWAGC